MRSQKTQKKPTYWSYCEWAPRRPRRTRAARWRRAPSRWRKPPQWPWSFSQSSPGLWTLQSRYWPWRACWPPLRRGASSCGSWGSRCGRCALGTRSPWEWAGRKSLELSSSRKLSVPTAWWTAPSSRAPPEPPQLERRWRSAGGCQWERRTRRRTPDRCSARGASGTSPSVCRWLDIDQSSSPRSCKWMQTCRRPAGTSPDDTTHPARRIGRWRPTWAAGKLGKRWPPDRPRTGGRRRRASWKAASSASTARKGHRSSGSLPWWRWWRGGLFPPEPDAHPAVGLHKQHPPRCRYWCSNSPFCHSCAVRWTHEGLQSVNQLKSTGEEISSSNSRRLRHHKQWATSVENQQRGSIPREGGATSKHTTYSQTKGREGG